MVLTLIRNAGLFLNHWRQDRASAWRLFVEAAIAF
jgi:hypothetical protein